MFNDLYARLARIIIYKKLLFVLIVIAAVILLLLSNFLSGMEFKGGTSIDIILNQNVSADKIESLKNELSARGLDDLNIYIKKQVTSNKRILTIQTTTGIDSENQEDIIKILEKYFRDLNNFDYAEVNLYERLQEDQIEKLSEKLNITSDGIKYDEDKNLLMIKAYYLDKNALKEILDYYFKRDVQFNFYAKNFIINPITPGLGEKEIKEVMKVSLIAYILIAFFIFVVFTKSISFRPIILTTSYIIPVIILIDINLINRVFFLGVAMAAYLILMAILIKKNKNLRGNSKCC